MSWESCARAARAQAAKRRVQGDIDDKPKLIELFEKIEGQAERAGAITQ